MQVNVWLDDETGEWLTRQAMQAGLPRSGAAAVLIRDAYTRQAQIRPAGVTYASDPDARETPRP